MKKKTKTYIVHDEGRLNLAFYEGYDDAVLLNKVLALIVFIEKHEEIGGIEFAGEKREIDKKFLESLRAEIYFSQFHQFEALFALILAIYQKLPHWLYLTTYSTSEVKEKVQMFLDNDFETLIGHKKVTRHDFIAGGVFMGYGYTGSKWKENIEGIGWNLQRLAEKYLKAQEYNAYKHGVRVVLGKHSVKLADITLSETEDSISYLETKKDETELNSVLMTTKHFSLEDSFNNMFFVSRLVKFIKVCRLASMKKSDWPSSVDSLFLLFDKEKVQMNDKGFSITMPV